MPTSRRLLVLVLLVAVGVLVAWPVVGRPVLEARETAREEARAEAAWPAQRAEIERVRDLVVLGSAFVPAPCPDRVVAGVTRCWVYDGAPDETLAQLEAAVADAGVDDVVADCSGPSARSGIDLACSAVGTVEGRAVGLLAHADVDVDATSRDDIVLGTSTVQLLADVDAP